MASQRLLIIALENLERDIRVQKQIATLKKNYAVTVAAFSKPPIDGVRFVSLERRTGKVLVPWLLGVASGVGGQLRLKLASFLPSLWRLEPYEVVLCNDVKSLPLGVWLKRRWKCGLVLDAHEYAPGEKKAVDGGGRPTRMRNRMAAICQDCFPEVDGALTVSSGIVNLYRENFGLAPKMLPNVPYREERDLTEREVRQPFQVICHGTGARGRGLMELVQLAPLVAPGWHINLMLVPPGGRQGREHYQEVLAEAEKEENITLKEPVAADAVVAEISQYDAGIYLMPGESPNKIHALPNKFFDFLQAGLAIFVGPELREMSAFVEEHGCGAVSREHTPESMAELLGGIDESSLLAMKRTSGAVAPAWCHEEMEHILLEVVESALSSPVRSGR